MIDLVQAGRAALQGAGRRAAHGWLTRIEGGIALNIAELRLSIHPDKVRVVQPGRGAALADILPPLCDRLGFAIRDIDAPCPGDILATMPARTAQGLDGPSSNADTSDDPEPGW